MLYSTLSETVIYVLEFIEITDFQETRADNEASSKAVKLDFYKTVILFFI